MHTWHPANQPRVHRPGLSNEQAPRNLLPSWIVQLQNNSCRTLRHYRPRHFASDSCKDTVIEKWLIGLRWLRLM